MTRLTYWSRWSRYRDSEAGLANLWAGAEFLADRQEVAEWNHVEGLEITQRYIIVI